MNAALRVITETARSLTALCSLAVCLTAGYVGCIAAQSGVRVFSDYWILTLLLWSTFVTGRTFWLLIRPAQLTPTSLWWKTPLLGTFVIVAAFIIADWLRERQTVRAGQIQPHRGAVEALSYSQFLPSCA
jgi:hypothetical protein